MYVDESNKSNDKYDMIIGRDLLQEIGLDFLFSQGLMTWENASVPMKGDEYWSSQNIDENELNLSFLQDPDTTEIERIQNILDAKYSPADIREEVHKCTKLNNSEREELLSLLNKYQDLFDGSLGEWQTQPIKIESKPEAKPYHARPYPVPQSQEQKLKNEVERLCKWGILKKCNNSEWAAPMFTISKSDGTLRSLADFQELNKMIKRKPFPIPKIQDMLHKLQGFQWVISLDLNMGYYHIVLDPDTIKYCTTVLPWGKYKYLRLPMGLCNSSDIFQENMLELMAALNFVRAYINDLLDITQGNFTKHLDQLEKGL